MKASVGIWRWMKGWSQQVATEPGLLSILLFQKLLQSEAEGGGLPILEPLATAVEFLEPLIGDLTLMPQDLELGRFLLSDRKRPAFEIGEIDLGLFFERLIQPLQVGSELLIVGGQFRGLRGVAFGRPLDPSNFIDLGVHDADALFNRIDLHRHPHLGILVVEEDLQQGENHHQLSEEEQGHHACTDRGEQEAVAMGPGASYQPYEIFHVGVCRRRGSPMSFLAWSGPWDGRRSSGGGISTRIRVIRQSELNRYGRGARASGKWGKIPILPRPKPGASAGGVRSAS